MVKRCETSATTGWFKDWDYERKWGMMARGSNVGVDVGRETFELGKDTVTLLKPFEPKKTRTTSSLLSDDPQLHQRKFQSYIKLIPIGQIIWKSTLAVHSIWFEWDQVLQPAPLLLCQVRSKHKSRRRYDNHEWCHGVISSKKEAQANSVKTAVASYSKNLTLTLSKVQSPLTRRNATWYRATFEIMRIHNEKTILWRVYAFQPVPQQPPTSFPLHTSSYPSHPCLLARQKHTHTHRERER